MRVEAEWVIRNLTIVDGSLNRVSANHLGSTNNEAFGYSVAMSGDGHTLAVGAPYYTNNDGTLLEEENVEELLYLNGEINDGNVYQMNLSETIISNEYDHFGFSIALNKNGNVLVVGAPQDISKDNANNDTGYVRIYGYKENLNNYELLTN